MATIEDVKKEFEAMKSIDMWVPREAVNYLDDHKTDVQEMLISMSVSEVADAVIQLSTTGCGDMPVEFR